MSLAPMESGDGLLVRVKPRAATLTAGAGGSGGGEVRPGGTATASSN